MAKGHTSRGEGPSGGERRSPRRRRSLIRANSDLELLLKWTEPATRWQAIGKQSVRCKNGHYKK